MTPPRRKKSFDELRSRRWFSLDDMRSMAHRSSAEQQGFAAEDFADKPMIAILNTWSDANPCQRLVGRLPPPGNGFLISRSPIGESDLMLMENIR